MLSEPWRIQLLGGFRISSGDREITHCNTRKAEELLGLLAYRLGEQCSREDLSARFWPESDWESSQTNLRVALTSLRRHLEPPGVEKGTILVSHGRSAVSLNPDAVTCDVVDVMRLLKRRPDLDGRDRVRSIVAAVELYRGELMPGHYGEWIEQIRNHLAEQFFSAMRELTTTMAESGDLDMAIEHAQRVVTEDPLCEESHRELMRLLTLADRPGDVVRAYENMTRVFDRERMGPPSGEITALLEQACSGERLVDPGSAAPGQAEAPSGSDWRRWDRLKTSPGSAAHAASPPPGLAPGRGGPNSDADEPDVPWDEAGSKPIEMDRSPVADAARAPSRIASPFTGEGQGGGEGVAPASVTRSASAGPTLPMQFTRFFGREGELARLDEYVTTGDERLVTLTGPGGAGKTRLAIEYALRHADDLDRRIVYVALADAQTGPEALACLADAMRVVARPGQDLLSRVEQELTTPTLLILDNLEQIVDEVAPIVLRLLQSAPSLIILATSRHMLDLTGERRLPVEPLPVPDGSDDPVRMMEFAAVQLFVDRAQRSAPDFQVTPRNAADVAQVCRRLEGLPLSLELAAAWVRDLPPAICSTEWAGSSTC